jgi:hypothetical protein
MCTGIEIAMLAGAALSAGSAIQQGNAKKDMQYQDAANVRDQALQEAQLIRRKTERESSAARAALAGSGTALDEFSMINTDEIQQLGAQDEAMTILTGKRQGRSLEYAGDMAYEAAKSEAIGGLAQAGFGAYTGWKGAKSASNSYSYNGDSGGTMYSQTGAGIRGRR